MREKLIRIIFLIVFCALIVNINSLSYGQIAQVPNYSNNARNAFFAPIFMDSQYHLNFLYTQWNLLPQVLQGVPDYIRSFHNYPSNLLYPAPNIFYFRFLPHKPAESVYSFQALWYAPFGMRPVMQRDSDGDGVPDNRDNCPHDPDKVEPGICGCGVPDTDSDADGTADCLDNCPNDPNKVEPGICGCGTADIDTDSDGTPDCLDNCPQDPENDIDGDGICGNVDNCPNTANQGQEDSDADGLGDACDPNTFRIRGFVSGNGLPVPGAQVRIGISTVTAFTDISGTFDTKVGIAELINHPDPADPNSQIFPIRVSANDFATGYYNLPFEPGGDPNYQVEIKLIAVSDMITEGDDVTAPTGVDIEKEGAKVGELFIPSDALPSGVTQVTGAVTYIDPTTSDLDSFPGADFLGAPADGNQPVILESFGAMDFDLEDQDGNPIIQLDGNATVCMKVPDSLSGSVSAGEEIPLWYYDPDTGIWKEEGSGIVEERDPNEFWICGEVTHFTWWNYDRPVYQHACFKFHFVDAVSGADVTGISWYAQGVTYSGTSPERTCNCDNDDPQPPCFDTGISSFTVKKSEPGMPPERIRVYTLSNGVNYYLVQVGDGTYQTTANPSMATIFDVPEENASCFRDVNVEDCHFLDENDPLDPNGSGCDLDPTRPVCGNNGILPLYPPNRAPVIASFTANPSKIAPGGTSSLEAVISDPENDDFTATWSTTCGAVENEGSSEESPGVFRYDADFNAPDQIGICKVTIEATDIHGNMSTAWVYIQVGEITGYLDGTIFGPDGSPLSDAMVSLSNQYYCVTKYQSTVYTDTNGYYRFEEIPCCENCGSYLGDFSGPLRVEFGVDSATWMYQQDINIDCCDRSTGGCTQDIHLPAVWGMLQGTAYNADGNPEKIDEWIWIRHNFNIGETEGSHVSAYESIRADGTYGPLPVPIGRNTMDTIGDDMIMDGEYREVLIAFKDQSIVADIGPGAKGTVTGIVYDDSGIPVDANIPVNISPGTVPALTDSSGGYMFTDIPAGGFTVSVDQGSNQFRSNEGFLNVKGEVANIDINNSGCSVTGILFDWMGQPVPFVDISLSMDWGTQYFADSNRTDINGVFSFTGVPNGPANFWAEYTDQATGIRGAVNIFQIGINQTCPGSLTIDLPLIPFPSTTGDCYRGQYPQ